MIRFNNFDIGQIRGNGFNFKQMKLNGNFLFNLQYELQESDILSSIDIDFTHQIEIAQVYDKYLLVVDGTDKKIYLLKLENDSLRIIETTEFDSITFSGYSIFANKNSRYFVLKANSSYYVQAKVYAFKITEDDTIEPITLKVSTGIKILFSENGKILTQYSGTSIYVYNIENELTYIGKLSISKIDNYFLNISKSGKYIFWHGLDSEETSYFNLYRTDTLERIPVSGSSSNTIEYACFSNDENKIAVIYTNSACYTYLINIDEETNTAEKANDIQLFNGSGLYFENVTFSEDDSYLGITINPDTSSNNYLCIINTKTLKLTRTKFSAYIYLLDGLKEYLMTSGSASCGLYSYDVNKNLSTKKYTFSKGMKPYRKKLYETYAYNLKKLSIVDNLMISHSYGSSTQSYIYKNEELIKTFTHNNSVDYFYYTIIKIGNYYFINQPWAKSGCVYCLKNARV